ncbi:GNAT family N-acetyltransferase [Rhizobium sp. RAF56]|uniref:GNAT family N-acetyltransferase n=1 Tax=Rhizobium sp. RAF56 TaxID=3233062 RepID=UPI003F977CA8
MYQLELRPTSAGGGIRAALSASGLPVDDLDEPGRSYFQLVDSEDGLVGYSGLEAAAGDFLLRSMVILPSFRSKGYGRRLTQMTITRTPSASEVYLATTNAAPFFESVGFRAVERDQVPQAILSTRQLSGLRPVSATIMKLSRPPI